MTTALRILTSVSLTWSMMTVALANAFGRQIRPFESVDLVSMSILPSARCVCLLVDNIEGNGKVVKWDNTTLRGKQPLSRRRDRRDRLEEEVGPRADLCVDVTETRCAYNGTGRFVQKKAASRPQCPRRNC